MKHTHNIIIKPLSSCISCIPRLAMIWQDVLGHHWLPHTSTQDSIKSLSLNIAEHSLPTTLVAFSDTKPVGMITLCQKDGLDSELRPWLSDFVVSAEKQGHGIGKNLMQAALKKSRGMGYKSLHLFTFDKNLPNYYQRFGWKTIGNDAYCSRPITIMKIHL